MTHPTPAKTAEQSSRRGLPAGALLVGVLLVGSCLAIRNFWPGETANADSARPLRTRPVAAPSNPGGQQASAGVPEILAKVNGEPITRNDLGGECLRHYGQEVLERVINKFLIMQECKARGITVSKAEVDAEIKRMATRFSLPVDRWLEMLKEERGINLSQYSGDIIWPSLALKKLAGDRLVVSEEELRKEHEKQFGPAVRARMIVCDVLQKAEAVHARAVANADDFGNLAKNESVDTTSASVKGLINPIRRHMGYKEIEDAAFSMREGQISPIIRVAEQYVILKCEGQIPAREVTLERSKPMLEEALRDRKLERVANEVFVELQKRSKVLNVLNNSVESAQRPGVAAVVNGHEITLGELAQVCIERHGAEVLEGMINRRLLEQACRQAKISVTEADVDQEIARVAAEQLPLAANGKPDVGKWVKLVTGEQGVSEEIYRHDSVWPSVALRKLVGDNVQVTDEDLKRGFEANYGPRVTCLAIVLGDMRRAQEVWQKAKDNSSREYFGELAEQYSVEPGSRALRGEVPPIQKHGGQPELEKEAFLLAEGELSGIVMVGPSKFVILRCEGRTKPIDVGFEQVRAEIHAEIYQKKLWLAMGDHFETLQREAAVDNILAGTTRSPKRSAPVRQAARPTTRTR
jgi:parvulin-like peptidyl-prolyl isomerase